MVKHEALAVRRARAGVATEEVDLDAVPALAQRTVEERLESAERVSRSAEVMRRLKRDEARALMLKAEGLSYVEIGERLGWTYTNVVSLVALFIALGGTSYALTLPRNSVGREQLRSNSVGTQEIRRGGVRSTDVRDRTLGVKDLSRRARETLKGAQGPAGPAGPAGPTYRAAIRATGGISRGNAIGSDPEGLNGYRVTFDRSVDDCVSTATLATVEGVAPPAGRVTVEHSRGSVLVRTFNAAGNAQGLPFNVVVAC